MARRLKPTPKPKSPGRIGCQVRPPSLLLAKSQSSSTPGRTGWKAYTVSESEGSTTKLITFVSGRHSQVAPPSRLRKVWQPPLQGGGASPMPLGGEPPAYTVSPSEGARVTLFSSTQAASGSATRRQKLPAVRLATRPPATTANTRDGLSGSTARSVIGNGAAGLVCGSARRRQAEPKELPR